ncbi:helicase-related protein [Aliivibrio sp. S4TY2]|uniref:helicase-related protein n=1 Tax=unclassified Aliivibrio TaxID=2645654 RepID=UPI002378C18C|nr:MULTISPECIES: helicase-related protein [unclassified Aliivibrio]MDD9155496.1 helicase-related protein [Aliivibrio sp. S4TY2]MDD9160363.1 helicase-related protein [Aliivibrio sp. S4TY1]MDD9164739.1 helicase-related protein [Aliivibrio sp. S4MY2]MDD9168545.1 helicase-related protein [Aliivibrio sp. S4MY4]MDD9185073.1 helicase-related protein [Aliivibrio sp. S4MY3]
MFLLPINAIHSEFSSVILTKNAVVQSETGSGKSTHLPLWAAEYGRVLVIEPRRIACTTLAEYLAQQSSKALGEDIGYAIKLDSRYCEESKIVFVTPGIALKWFMEDKLVSFSHIMIDEFHERRWDTDLLLSLLHDHQQHRLILTSATIDTKPLASYANATVLTAKGRQFTVQISHVSEHSQQMPSARDIEQRIISTLKTVIQRGETGDILVFLPGKKEIIQCVQIAAGLYPNHQVIPLFAGVSDLHRKQALTQSSQQRIIFSTNVAETSLTIPNVTVVIDSGLERRAHQRNGRTTLSLQAISKASAEQRSGRAGRTQSGQALRLYGEHAPLEKMTPPELQREELVEAVLASASCKKALREMTFLEPLPEKSLALAEEKLQQMGAINSELMITDYGLQLFPLPIDTLFSHMLSVVKGRSEKETVADLVAGLSVSNKLFSIANSEMARDEFLRWNPKSCDLVTLVSIVRGHNCDGLMIDDELRKEAQALAKQIRSELGLPELAASSRLKREEVLQQLVEKLPELVFVRREKRREAFGNGNLEVVLGRNHHFLPVDEAAIIFNQFSLPGRGNKQTLTIATALAPIDASWVIESGLAERRVGECVNDNQDIKIAYDYYYANRLLKTVYVEPKEEDAIAVIVSQVIDGCILPSLKEKRETEIAAWQLYCQLNGNNKISIMTFESWFTQQLRELGVTSLDDMEMFAEDDFIYDGIPEWELSDFLATYPQIVVLPDITVSVEYFPSSKRIVLTYLKGDRKNDLKRWELPTWSGWCIQYKKASRKVDIR